MVSQVGSALINRVASTDVRWHQDVTNAAPRVSPIIDLTLDDLSVKRAIDNLNFIQIKCKWSFAHEKSDFLGKNAIFSILPKTIFLFCPDLVITDFN